MTTAAPRNDVPATLEELEERTQDAWGAYRESLRELSGRDYDDAEAGAWDRLQRELHGLDERRAQLIAPNT
jgi:hypothetical protein